jgi:hypothetical protein
MIPGGEAMLIVQISTPRESPQLEAAGRDLHHSYRPGGEHLTDPSRQRIISARPLGLAAVAKILPVTRKRVVSSTNDPVYPIAAINFLRNHFRIDHCEVILHAQEDPIRQGRFDWYGVADPWLDLPVRSLMYVVERRRQTGLNRMPVCGGGRTKGQIELTACAVETALAKRPPSPAGTLDEVIGVPRHLDPKEVGPLVWHAVAGLVSGQAGVTAPAPTGLGPRTACPTTTGWRRRGSKRRCRTARKGIGATQRANKEPLNG